MTRGQTIATGIAIGAALAFLFALLIDWAWKDPDQR